jgi:hypothetical protein
MLRSKNLFSFIFLLVLIGCTPLSCAKRSPEPEVSTQDDSETLIITAETEDTEQVVQIPNTAETIETVETVVPLPGAAQGASQLGIELHDFGTLQKAEAFGNRWVRYNGLLWSDYQNSSASQFVGDPELEANMIAVSEAGMELILVIRSTPTWAQKYAGYYCGPMAEDYLDDFAAFMGQVVAKYSADPYNVQYFELWNEPDESRESVYSPDAVLGCWGEPDETFFGGAYYGEMLKQVYPAMKEANPNAKVVIGGLLLPCLPGTHPYCNMSRFFAGILEVGGGDYFDYVGFHTYTSYDPGQPNVIQMERNEHWWATSGGQVEGKLGYLKSVMVDHQVEKPILLTETALIDPNNHAVEDPEAFEHAKADYLVWTYSRNIARGMEGTIWYYLDQYGWNKSGLLDRINEPLPAYTAYQFLADTLGDAVYLQDLSLDEGILGFEFAKDDQRVWLLFSEDGGQRYIDTPVGSTTVYTLFGEAESPSLDGRISFTRPTYVIISP